jgi:hypothetical protein
MPGSRKYSIQELYPPAAALFGLKGARFRGVFLERRSALRLRQVEPPPKKLRHARIAAKLRSANVQFRDFTQPVPQGYDHEKIVNEIGTQTTWFTDQLVGFGAKKRLRSTWISASREKKTCGHSHAAGCPT